MQLASNLISYGSCQFPTLGFVVERYRAVESFISEQFWKIAGLYMIVIYFAFHDSLSCIFTVTHVVNDLKVDFNWKRVRLFDEQACIAIHDVCTENPQARVETVNSKPKSKWRPLPLDTVVRSISQLYYT